ncbi:MAG TPA: hypothetical protein VN632_00425 [Stellaceae bacterium]|nr:hypothetical protein [Stellaceae bacterium]
MICEIDIWQAAQDLLQRYGAEAARRAAVRADESGRARDPASQKTWLEILRVVTELRRFRLAESARRVSPPGVGHSDAAIVALRRRERPVAGRSQHRRAART